MWGFSENFPLFISVIVSICDQLTNCTRLESSSLFAWSLQLRHNSSVVLLLTIKGKSRLQRVDCQQLF